MLKYFTPAAIFILVSVAAASAADGAPPPKGEWSVPSVLGLIPALLGAVYALMDRLGRHGRYANAKSALELIKLKLEIEGIRRNQQLDLPQISVTPEDLAALQQPVATHFEWFDPRSLRKSRWYRLAHNHPRWGPRFGTLASAIAAFYGAGSLFAAVFLVSSKDLKEAFGSVGSAIAIGISYAVFGVLLIMGSVRIHRARKLALAELHPVG